MPISYIALWLAQTNLLSDPDRVGSSGAMWYLLTYSIVEQLVSTAVSDHYCSKHSLISRTQSINTFWRGSRLKQNNILISNFQVLGLIIILIRMACTILVNLWKFWPLREKILVMYRSPEILNKIVAVISKRLTWLKWPVFSGPNSTWQALNTIFINYF